MLEKEYKILLQENEIKELKKIFNFKNKIIQKNIYYDTENFELLKKGITFRIREIQNKKKVQIKIPKNLEKEYSEKYEYEYEINEIPFLFNPKELVEKYGIEINKSLKNIGKLITERSFYKYNKDITIFIDENYYFEKKDFELEIEFCNLGSIKEIENILFDLNIINNKCKGKYLRFYKSYIERN